MPKGDPLNKFYLLRLTEAEKCDVRIASKRMKISGNSFIRQAIDEKIDRMLGKGIQDEKENLRKVREEVQP